MPVVDKNQLKIWFKNLAKPVQEQFWNWMDSFYHKSEPIPKSAVENLTTDLAKKADLVGGVVPASQLPFSVNTSEVIAVGEISATENTVTLAVHSSGANAVRINGVVLTRTFPNTFNFTPVTDGSKFLIIYAVNDSGIFRLAEGVEDLEAVEPEIPVGALFVRRILINSAGADVELPSLNGFREKVEDDWKAYTFYAPGEEKLLPFTTDKKTSYIIKKATNFDGDLLLVGMKSKITDSDNWWPGKEFTVFNQTPNNLILVAGYTGTGVTFNIASNVTVPGGKFVKLKVSADLSSLEVLQLSGDSVNIDGKLNKPTTRGNAASYPYVVGEDGNGNSARLLTKDLEKNFFNSNLQNSSARNHTMNAGVTINTLGNPHTLSGLPNKNADIANFRKVRVQNTSGLDAVVDSKDMLLDMPSYLTEQERTAWKTAMNGGWTTNTMSVALISPFIIKNDNNVNWILLKGANLNLPPTSFEVAIMNEEGTSVLAIVPNSQVQLYTNGTDLIFYYNFFTLGLGKYKIRLWNGVAYYITNSKLTVTDTITNIPFQQGEIRLVSGSSSINVATAYEVILKPDPNIKAQPTNRLNALSDIVSNWVDGNVLQGNEDWWVQLSVGCIVTSRFSERVDIANVGLSSSSSSSSLLSPTVGGILIYNLPTAGSNSQPSDIGIIGGSTLNDLANGSQINYIKIGSILQILIIASNGTIVSSTTTIDTSKTYILVANCNNQPTDTNNSQAGIKLTKVRISNL